MPGAKPEAALPPEPHGPPPGRRSEASLGAKGLHGSDGDGVLAFAASREASVVEVPDLELTLTLTLPLTLTLTLTQVHDLEQDLEQEVQDLEGGWAGHASSGGDQQHAGGVAAQEL